MTSKMQRLPLNKRLRTRSNCCVQIRIQIKYRKYGTKKWKKTSVAITKKGEGEVIINFLFANGRKFVIITKDMNRIEEVSLWQRMQRTHIQ